VTVVLLQTGIVPGEPGVHESAPEGGVYGVSFEDDGETGYLYGLDLSRPEDQTIVDALHIYNAPAPGLPSPLLTLQIVWNDEGTGCVLVLDGTPHAAFDFAGQRACCRTNFPPPSRPGGYTASHAWDEEMVGRLLGPAPV
jgi:hypothetical protein